MADSGQNKLGDCLVEKIWLTWARGGADAAIAMVIKSSEPKYGPRKMIPPKLMPKAVAFEPHSTSPALSTSSPSTLFPHQKMHKNVDCPQISSPLKGLAERIPTISCIFDHHETHTSAMDGSFQFFSCWPWIAYPSSQKALPGSIKHIQFLRTLDKYSSNVPRR
jgi:hypothetical protein